MKSYAGDKPYFYWTRNEVETAKRLQEKYFIYLIDREKINNPNYEPVMIPNPIENILENNDWCKNIDKYYIEAFSI